MYPVEFGNILNGQTQMHASEIDTTTTGTDIIATTGIDMITTGIDTTTTGIEIQNTGTAVDDTF